MAGKKNLGMGLDLLLSSAGAINSQNDTHFLEQSKELMNKALSADNSRCPFEAYYYYRKLIDSVPDQEMHTSPEILSTVSQACNNAGVILFEHGYSNDAIKLLELALKLDPQNRTAGENFKAISE
ncbi:MAG: tetratricopeptide repeat protein [Chitinophagales bacterium]